MGVVVVDVGVKWGSEFSDFFKNNILHLTKPIALTLIVHCLNNCFTKWPLISTLENIEDLKS